MAFEFICDGCGKKFYRHNQTIKENCNQRFCSHKCYSKNRRNGSVKPCPICGKPVYFAKSSRASGRRYCSRDCYVKSHKKIMIQKTCIGCGKRFEISKATSQRFNYCSMKCKRKTSGMKILYCKRCGKPFNWSSSDIKRGLSRTYCSEECRRPPVLIKCEICGTEFRIIPSKKNTRRYCSFRCYRRSNKRTSIEKSMKKALTSLNLIFIEQEAIGRYTVDFCLPIHKSIIEVDGTYWHKDIKKDLRKTNYLIKKGWQVLRFTEIEINNSKNLSILVKARLYN